jgi:preprotein translocase subunit SecB
MSEENAIQPSLSVRRIFLKDASLEMPSGAKIFNEDWNPSVNMDVAVNNEALDETHYEVTLTLTVKVETAGKTAFLIEVHNAGIVALEGMNEEQRSHVLGAVCPNILFPYARESVDNLATKASFPPLMLAPINFDALYEQSKQSDNVPTLTVPAEAMTH